VTLAIVLELLGAALLLAGIALFSVPAAFICGGILMLALGLYLDVKVAKSTTGTN